MARIAGMHGCQGFGWDITGDLSPLSTFYERDTDRRGVDVAAMIAAVQNDGKEQIQDRYLPLLRSEPWLKAVESGDHSRDPNARNKS